MPPPYRVPPGVSSHSVAAPGPSSTGSVPAVDDAQAWDDFCDQLRRAGHTALEAATDPLEAAEGLRFVTRLLSAAVDMTVAYADPARPAFVRLMTDRRKFYGDNPDTDYDYASIRGRHGYRIAGERGTSSYLACCVYGRNEDGSTRIVANVSDRDLDLTDGRFEIVLSADRPDDLGTATWVQLTPDADVAIVRQYYLDRSAETPATFDIWCTDQVGPPPPVTGEWMARRLRAAGTFVSLGTEFSAAMAAQLEAQPNGVVIDSEASTVAGFYPTPDNKYVGGWFQLADGEALEVTGRPPDTRYWSLLLMSRWMESLDTSFHTTILNCSQVELEDDGTFRILVADRDPGVANWLDTAGHRQGYVLFRWMQATGITRPEFRVVPLD